MEAAMNSVGNNEEFSVNTIEEVEDLYGVPSDSAIKKQTTKIVEPGRAFIEASPFLLMATSSDAGVDCSPKGDAPGFVDILDDRTLLIPDRIGNNRVDGIRNIISNSKVGIIFMVPGSDVTYRVNGKARVSIDPSFLDRFIVRNKRPRAVIVVEVEEAFHHCPKAFVRSKFWSEGAKGVPDGVPNSGAFAAYRDGGDRSYAEKYEVDYQERLKDRLY
ncbi:MAG: pyridoxamine 5'-phosphate oxidase [Rhodospirillaceae bacterium]|nr:pyridoxamine 5'-phosphate oxidase [Rhodospirillaceae bacterium]